MKIDCIGCCHGAYDQLELEGGDLLIITGDLTRSDESYQYSKFHEWLEKQDYKKKIFIGGNHDQYLQDRNQTFLQDYTSNDSITYLCDSGTEFEGLKIWGMPHSLWFRGINPHCTAFTGDEEYMAEKCALIPDNIDILISHCHPYGILDEIILEDGSEYSVGSKELLKTTLKIRPKLVIFSHIHEKGGKILDINGIKFINCSIMNERYEPVNKPMKIEI